MDVPSTIADDILIDLPKRRDGHIPIHPTIGTGLNRTDQRATNIASTATQDLSEKGCCNKKFAVKALKVGFFWSGFFVSLGAVATAVATYVFSEECPVFNASSTDAETNSQAGAGIANIVVTGATTFFTFLRECYNYKEDEQNKKEAFIERTTREQLEKERYEELHQMLVETSTSLHQYERNKNTANFQNCLQTIKNLPEGSKNCPPIRDEWLSKLIAVSDTQKELQQALEQLEQLGKEIRTTNKETIEIPLNMDSRKGAGESSAQAIDTNTRIEKLGKSLETYQNVWEALTGELGFCPQSVCINGISYTKHGQMAPAKEVRIKI